MKFRERLKNLLNSIGTKIILPYVLLTLIVAGVGAFIVTNLVTGTLQERFDNQLLDSGRVVAEIMVDIEQTRLAALRSVAGTEGVPDGVANQDTQKLAALIPQIIANSNNDAVIIINNQGIDIFSWYKDQEISTLGADFSSFEDVQLVLNGFVDEAGNRRVMLMQTPKGLLLFTIGPILQDSEQVGAVLIGTDVENLVQNLTDNAVARVTLYNNSGEVVATTLAPGQNNLGEIIRETPEWYQKVTSMAHEQVLTRSINLLGQDYLLAFGDWRIRGQSFGMYSVALPSNFIYTATTASRNSLSLVFSMATVGVIAIGYLVSRRIVSPLNRLVHTSAAVTDGNLEQRTGIDSGDEIGVLANAFDTMTQSLALRNKQLIEQASNLEAILHSIADGVVVFDENKQIVTLNPAARQILQDLAYTTSQEVEESSTNLVMNENLRDWLTKLTTSARPQRYRIGHRVFSALPSPVISPTGDTAGYVVVMRDITRQVEAEERQNNFISNVSHELRTPLTSIKGYTGLLLASGKENLKEQQLQFTNIIDENTDKLINHVNRLIEIAEIQAGTLKLDRERVSFRQITSETVQAWKEKMSDKLLSFDVDLGEEDLWILGDAARLSWVIDNLIQNAYDYTLEGGKVKVWLSQEKGYACLSVSDTGVGINATAQPYIFDRFYRVEHELTLNTPGMGLGLFIARYILDEHNGSTSVESHQGKGSTFVISLPLDESEEQML
jgi:PAS domain S-box-containing protein